jgi:hypothetical protein
MDKITIHTDAYGEVHVIIDNSDGSFTSMSKAFYDEQKAQAEYFTPMVSDEAPSI